MSRKADGPEPALDALVERPAPAPAGELSRAWLEFFALLPNGWTIHRPVAGFTEGAWILRAVRKPGYRGDGTVRIEARGADEVAAVRALSCEFRRLGYARSGRPEPGGRHRIRHP